MSRDQRSGPIRAVLADRAILGAAGGGFESLRAAWAMRAHRWWIRSPFLPIPDKEYLRWRRFTAYGDPSTAMDMKDLQAFLRWRSAFRRYVKEVA